jgi:uncharacterized lipoprotein YddW (UPF0748 family)
MIARTARRSILSGVAAMLAVAGSLAAQETPVVTPVPAPALTLPTRGLPYAPLGEPNDSMPPPLPREFRGVWIATVDNIDWPSAPGLPVAQQKAELLGLFDRAAALGLNAIVFQVRPSADALYDSKLEPWSSYLTGRQGHAPSPWYDPLAFAVQEAHRRGMELHAWFNPYRARHPADPSPASPSHVSRAKPGLVRRYGTYLWMDPAERAVRNQTVRVIIDVVKRYDVDGVHLDDYFYPYPVTNRRGAEVPFPDASAWRRYRQSGGKLSRDNWRRRNVDLLIDTLYHAVKKAKPWVKFGISPFGIWRPGHPEQIRGLDAYTKLYADARKWLENGWVDYFTPQLYWREGAPAQRYSVLLDWWVDNNPKSRHIWPGNFTSRVTDRGSVQWPSSEILDQIRLTRAQPGAGGNVHFSMTAFLRNIDSLSERIARELYAVPAIVPSSPWLSEELPLAPRASLKLPRDTTETMLVTVAPAGKAPPALWIVRARYADGWRARVVHGAERVVVLDAPPVAVATLLLPTAERPPGIADLIVITAVDRYGVESAPVWLRPFVTPKPADSARAARAP